MPPLALRAGDFRGRNVIYDPATTRPDPNRPGQFIRDPFPNNVIPADRIDPVARRTLDMLFPLPDRAGNVQNLFAPLRNDTTEDQFTVRVDHQFSNKNHTFARYSMTDPRRYNTSFANLPNYADWWNTKAHNAVASNTYVFSQRLVNEVRFGYNRMFQYLVSTDQRDIPTMLGITGTQSDIYPGPPTISISGYDSTASLSFAKILQLTRELQIVLVLTGISPRMQVQLIQSGIIPEIGILELFADLDHGVEWYEDQVIAEAGQANSPPQTLRKKLRAVMVEAEPQAEAKGQRRRPVIRIGVGIGGIAVAVAIPGAGIWVVIRVAVSGIIGGIPPIVRIILGVCRPDCAARRQQAGGEEGGGEHRTAEPTSGGCDGHDMLRSGS